MRTSRMLAATLFFVTPALAQAVPAPAENWVKLGESEGITVLRQEVPGDPVYAYRGVGTLEAPLGKLVTVSRDVKRLHEWVNRLEEAHVLREIAPGHRIIYFKVDPPWPVSDRDFVVESTLTVDRATRSAVVEFHSVEDPLAPPNDCCVRGIVHRNKVTLVSKESGKRTEIDAEAHVDPRGSLPGWMVNLVQKTFPRKSIAGLLRQVAKPDVRDEFLAEFSGEFGQPSL